MAAWAAPLWTVLILAAHAGSTDAARDHHVSLPVAPLRAARPRPALYDDGLDHRNVFCAEADALSLQLDGRGSAAAGSPESELVALGRALAGRTVHAAVEHPSEPMLADFDPVTGAWSGMHIEMLALLAERGSFGYQLTLMPPRPANMSATQWLDHTLMRYDLVLGAFAGTKERAWLSVLSAFRVWDASLVAATRGQRRRDVSLRHELMLILLPFTRGAWLCIVSLVVGTALLYAVFESAHLRGSRSAGGGAHPFVASLQTSLYQTSHHVATQGALAPATRAGKLVALSWSTAAMLIVAAYTAHLTKLLVIDSALQTDYASLEEAVGAGAKVCVWDNADGEEFMRHFYPTAKLVRTDGSPFEQMASAGCRVALGDSAELELALHGTANADCTLTALGPRLDYAEAGWAVRGDFGGRTCSALVKGSLHALSLDAAEDLRRIYDDFRARAGTVQCAAAEDSADELGAGVMSGIVCLHVALVLIALLTWAVDGRTGGSGKPPPDPGAQVVPSIGVGADGVVSAEPADKPGAHGGGSSAQWGIEVAAAQAGVDIRDLADALELVRRVRARDPAPSAAAATAGDTGDAAASRNHQHGSAVAHVGHAQPAAAGSSAGATTAAATHDEPDSQRQLQVQPQAPAAAGFSSPWLSSSADVMMH